MMLKNIYNNPFPYFFTENNVLPINLRETDSQYIVEAKVPWVKKEDIEIDFQDRILSIKYELETESDGNLLIKEYSDGVYARKIRLPAEVDEDKIVAKTENGIIRVTFEKVEKATPKKIEIK